MSFEPLPADVISALSGSGVRFDVFLFIDASTPVRAWSGVTAYAYPGDSVDTAGGSYLGLGRLSGIPQLNQLLNGGAQRVEFVLSGVDPEVVALADAEAPILRNANAYLGLALWSEDYELIGGQFWWLWSGIADAPRFNQTPGDNGLPLRLVALSCATLMSSRRRPRYGYWTDVQHQILYPGDTFFSQVALYNSATTVVWPQ